MTKDDIVTIPSPLLRQTSRRIAVIDDEVKQLAQGLIDTMKDWESGRPNETAAAIAAVQVGQTTRIIAIRSAYNKDEEAKYDVYINPEIVKAEGELEADSEGCLSVPDVYAMVPRPSKVKLKALNLAGQAVRITAEGFLARVFQHEVDHLQGKLFIDHVTDGKFYHLQKNGELKELGPDEVKQTGILRYRRG